MNDVDFTAGSASGHRITENHRRCAVGGTEDFPGGQPAFDAQPGGAAGEYNPPAPANHAATPRNAPPVLAPNPWANHNGPLLALLADAVDDIEHIRKATANRLRQLTRTAPDADGQERGFGLTLDFPQVKAVADMLKTIRHDDKVLKDIGYPAGIVRQLDENGKPTGRACRCLECQAVRNLQKEMRKHPLGPWVAANSGVGEKQAARLIAAIGDPYWNALEGRPRLVSELWSYCGYRPGARRRRGERAKWSTVAKTRAYLVAVSCLKAAGSHWAEVYAKRKAHTEGRLHAEPCPPCGASKGPAPVGTPWRDGHRHADALRITAKALLKDMWRESRRLHGITDDEADR